MIHAIAFVDRLITILQVTLCLAILCQFTIFISILRQDEPLQSANVIIVFQGAEHRAREAYQLISQGYASSLVVSPATDQRLALYIRQYQPTRIFNTIIEDQARTTFENAFYCRSIIQHNGFKSAILVTSWNHMPRSYLLMKALTTGLNIRIQPHHVATGRLTQQNWFVHNIGWKMIYNEILETESNFLYSNKTILTLPTNLADMYNL